MKSREEKDTMGPVHIPENSLYGPQTQRAVENFPISGLRFSASFIHALALIKKSASEVNAELQIIDKKLAAAIGQASQEIMEGKFEDQFVVDIFQTGSGTSTNMNMNEVIATRANEILIGKKQGKDPVHPNDHVNTGQSSNDVIPSAIHISALLLIRDQLIPSLVNLKTNLSKKSSEFKNTHKIGRTHLQDAVPMTLGEEFSGYARQIELGINRVEAVQERLSELAIGGTAIGNGLNAHPNFASKVIKHISNHTKLPFKEAKNHFEAQASQDASVETSGALKTIAVSLIKIGNDIRWLSSGPRCGIGEITLPALQPGSSIMPGKVNPVIPEAVIQVAAQVIGNDTTITFGGQAGNFELNVMLPVIAYNLLQSITLLSSVSNVFADKCVSGIMANKDKSESFINQSLALATNLIPHIGYDKAAEIAKKAFETGKTIKETALNEKVLPEDVLESLF
jgi:fumarate hydratase class II